MISIRYKNYKSNEDINELKSLKNSFKKLMKKNIFLYKKNQFYKIGNLIKVNNGKMFFKKVNAFMNKNKNCDLDINNVQAHYEDIFNESINVNVVTMNEIELGIGDLIHENFSCIDFSHVELNYACRKNHR